MEASDWKTTKIYNDNGFLGYKNAEKRNGGDSSTNINNFEYKSSFYLNPTEQPNPEDGKTNYLALFRPLTQTFMSTGNEEGNQFETVLDNNPKLLNISVSCPSSSGINSITENFPSSRGVIKDPKTGYSSNNSRLLSSGQFKDENIRSLSTDQNIIFSNKNQSSKEINSKKFMLNYNRSFSSVDIQGASAKKISSNVSNSITCSRDLRDIFLKPISDKRTYNDQGIDSFLVSSLSKSYEDVNFSNNILPQTNGQNAIALIKSRYSPLTSSSGNQLRPLTPKGLDVIGVDDQNIQSGLGNLLEAAKQLNSTDSQYSNEHALPKIRAVANTKQRQRGKSPVDFTSKKGTIIFQGMENLEFCFVDATSFCNEKPETLTYEHETELLYGDCYRDLSHYNSDTDYSRKEKKLFAKRMGILNFKAQKKKTLLRFDRLAKMDMKRLGVESRFQRINSSSTLPKEISKLKGIMMVEEASLYTKKTKKKLALLELKTKNEKEKGTNIEASEHPAVAQMSKEEATLKAKLTNESKPSFKEETILYKKKFNVSNRITSDTFAKSASFAKLSFKKTSLKDKQPTQISSSLAKTRSKKGCWTCRLRKKKCSEEKNQCGNCLRLGVPCDYSIVRPDYMMNDEARLAKQIELKNLSLRFKTGMLTNQTYSEKPNLNPISF